MDTDITRFTFTCDGNSYTFMLHLHVNVNIVSGDPDCPHCYMTNMSDGGNDVVFVYVLGRSFPGIRTDGMQYHVFKNKWVTKIIDNELQSTYGVWPVTETKEDCIKIINYLDMLTKMNTEDCRAYLLNHINDLLIEYLIEEF